MDNPASQAEAAQVLRLALDLMRLLSSGMLGKKRFASNADDVLLLAAVWIGHAEGKPMPAYKLAMYCGMARPTAVRKLKEYESAGIVTALPGGRYVPSDGRTDAEAARQAITAAVARLDAWGRRPVA